MNPWLLLFLVEDAQSVEDEVGVAEGLDSDRVLVRSLLKLERPAGDFYDSLKTRFTAFPAANSIHDPAVAEHHLALMFFAVESQNSVQPRIFDDLHRVEDADCAEIPGQCEVFLFEVGLGGRGRRFEIRAPSATDCFETAGDVDAFVELFGFEQAVVGRVEVFAFDVEARQGETLAGRFFDLFLRRADLAEAFAELDGAGVELEGGAEAFDGPIRRLVFHKELGVEEGGLDFADMLGL